MKYCLRCGLEFPRKCNLNKHLSRKKECEINYLDIAPEMVKNEYDYYYNEFKKVRKITKRSKTITGEITKRSKTITREITKRSLKDPEIKCTECGKEFSFSTNLYRHKKLYCSAIKLEQEKMDLTRQFLDAKCDQLKLECEAKMDEQKENFEEQKEELMNRVEELDQKLRDLAERSLIVSNGSGSGSGSGSEDSNGNNNSNNSGDNNSNSNNTNSNNVTQINNIQINGFGQEDLSNLSDKTILNILRTKYQAPSKLVKAINIDMKENRNTYLPNPKDKYGLVYDSLRWLYKDQNEIVDELILNNMNRIFNFMDKYNNFLGNQVCNKLDEMLDKYSTDEVLKTRYKNEVRTILLNDGKMIKDFYEENYGKRLIAGEKTVITL